MRSVVVIFVLICSPVVGQLYLEGGFNYSPHKVTGPSSNYNINQLGINLGVDKHFRLFKSEHISLGLGVRANLLLRNRRNDIGIKGGNTFPDPIFRYDDNEYWFMPEFPVDIVFKWDKYAISGGVLLNGVRQTLGAYEKIRIEGFRSYLISFSRSLNDKIALQAMVFMAIDDIYRSSGPEGTTRLKRNGISVTVKYQLGSKD